MKISRDAYEFLLQLLEKQKGNKTFRIGFNEKST